MMASIWARLQSSTELLHTLGCHLLSITDTESGRLSDSPAAATHYLWLVCSCVSFVKDILGDNEVHAPVAIHHLAGEHTGHNTN